MSHFDEIIPSYIRDLSGYRGVQPAAEKRIRLDAMESPYGLENLQAAWQEVLAQAEINRYPVAHSPAFLRRLKEGFQLPPENEVLLGNGSDEIILLLLLLCGGSRVRVMSPAPSFIMYEYLTRVLGGTYIGIPLEENFSLKTDKFIEAIKQQRPHLIFIALPNNPTGNLFDTDIVSRSVAASEGLVVVDQAYRFFAPPYNPYELSPKHKNLLLMQTLSKLGMAGLRFGFLSADPQLVAELHKIRLPYNINALTLVSVQFALDHLQYFLDKGRLIVEAREHLYAELHALDAIQAYPSAANFILFRCLKHSATQVFNRLKAHGILIKNLHNGHPTLRNCLRVSMGLPTENRAFMQVLQDALIRK